MYPRAVDSLWTRLLFPVLLLVNAALIGLVQFTSTTAISIEAVPPPVRSDNASGAKPSTVVSEVPEAPNATELTTTLARPLFRSDRRPPKEGILTRIETTPASMPPPSLPFAAAPLPIVPTLTVPQDLRLVGIVAQPGKGLRALLRKDAISNGASHVVGDVIGGWRLIEVKPDAVVVEAAGQRRVIDLFGPQNAAVPRNP